MSQEIQVKRAMCYCPTHCRVAVNVKDGELISVDYKKKKETLTAERWSTVVSGCPRAVYAKDWFYHPLRLDYPLKRSGERGENKWQRISWKQAFDEIAQKLKELREKYGPETLVFNTIGEHNTCEIFRGRFQNLFGTPNYISSATICFGEGIMLSTLLSGGWPIYFPHIRPETKCIVIWGANPDVTWPYIGQAIEDARKNGCKIIVVDPRRIDAVANADSWLQLRPGTDCALLLGMINMIIKEGLYDKDFVERWCHGFDKLTERAQGYPLEKVAEITGVPASKIEEATRLYATNKPGMIFNSMGIEQIPNHIPALHARNILPAIVGNIDVLGGELLGPRPTKMRPGVEIDLNDKLSLEQKAKQIGGGRFKLLSWTAWEMARQAAEKVGEVPIPAFWTVIASAPLVFRSIIEEKPYPIKALITEATNPLLTFSNTKLVYEAFKKLDLHVAIDVVMTSTCQLADYVLPAASWLEKAVIHGGEYDEIAHGGEAALSPVKEGQYERKPEYEIWRELGIRLGQEEHWPWKTLEEALSYRLEPLGLTFEEFIDGGGVIPFTYDPKRYEKGGFGTPTGKFELYSTVLEKLGYDPLPQYKEPPQSPISTPDMAKEYPLILINAKRRWYYHSQFRQIESLRKRYPDPLVQINPSKAKELGIADGDWVWIETPLGRVKHKCEYFEGIDPQVVSAEYGWTFPEKPAADPSLYGLWESNINVIIDDALEYCDPISGGWPLRAIMCKVYKMEG